MGGSGGFFYDNSIEPEDITKKIRKEEVTSRDEAFETEVSDFIRDLLSDVNNRNIDQIQKHLNTIKSALEAEMKGSIDIRYGGSVSKHTYVDGLSDIDSLAILNNTQLANSYPHEIKEYFAKLLRQRLPDTKITVGRLAVTLSFSTGYEIQILPCLKVGDGIKIPSSREENAWSKIVKPSIFVMKLRFMNIKMSGKLIPVIKLAKSIISSFPENRKLSGYHTEALAVDIFSDYKGVSTPRAMLQYFFNKGANRVLSPLSDSTGQSYHVDSYLGSANSLERRIVYDSMSKVARRMQNADGSRDMRLWKDILK